MKKKSLFMETTKINPAQTVGEIQRVLGLYGASAIRMDYLNGEVVSVSFTIQLNGEHVPFRLPCRWNPIYQHLRSKLKIKTHDEKFLKKREPEWIGQAKKIAWRQIYRWVEAQLALVDTDMVKMEEVFLPYLLLDKGQTLFEKMAGQNWKFQIEHKKRREEGC